MTRASVVDFRALNYLLTPAGTDRIKRQLPSRKNSPNSAAIIGNGQDSTRHSSRNCFRWTLVTVTRNFEAVRNHVLVISATLINNYRPTCVLHIYGANGTVDMRGSVVLQCWSIDRMDRIVNDIIILYAADWSECNKQRCLHCCDMSHDESSMAVIFGRPVTILGCGWE